MPNRRPPPICAKAAPPTRATFRKHYDDLEEKRGALVARLRMLGGISQQHPGYKRALTLLNGTFRRSKVAQRLAVLEAAAWLIDVLEHFATIV